jgi:hypothetical protein
MGVAMLKLICFMVGNINTSYSLTTTKNFDEYEVSTWAKFHICNLQMDQSAVWIPVKGQLYSQIVLCLN